MGANSAAMPIDDSLGSLHRMSRTAGLGSGDYVAINVIAVTSVIFGLASALVIVDPLFLAIPIVGLVLSVVAIRQVLQSNGTQSGAVMAVAGFLLALGFFSYRVGGQVVGEIRTSSDRAQIEKLINTLGQDLDKGDASSLADGYGKFDSVFTSRVPLARFAAVFNASRVSRYMGAVVSLESNGQLKFDVDPRTGEQTAQAIAIVHLAKGSLDDAPRWSCLFRKENGHWAIEDMPEVFPAPQATAAQTGNSQTPAPPAGASQAVPANRPLPQPSR